MLLGLRRKNPYRELEKKLGYAFKRRALLEMALTHRSYRFETRDIEEDNQRLEFLGDAVLGFIVAAHLYDAHAEGREGTLTDLRSSVTSGKALGAIGKAMELGEFVRLGKGEEAAGGRQRASLLSDCVEAVIGAAYLDGGVKAAERIVEKVVIPQFSPGRMADWTDNPKGKLQEISQRRYGKSPEYRRVGEAGPAHQKTFVIDALVNGQSLGRGTGSNRRAAEAEAATQAVMALLSPPGVGRAADEPGFPG
jgi:ribonuclease-3